MIVCLLKSFLVTNYYVLTMCISVYFGMNYVVRDAFENISLP